MSDRCSNSATHDSHRCPVNGKEYKEVSAKTILHHIRQPWNWNDNQQSYYFCDDPDCDVVYFGQDDSVIEKSAVRTNIGIKDKSDNALICYCFGVTANEAAMRTRRRESSCWNRPKGTPVNVKHAILQAGVV